MERRIDKKMVICGVAAALCFAALFAATFRSRAQRGQRTVAMVSFGDSVYTDIGGMEPIPDRLAERLGISSYNASMGGTCAARLEAERRLDSAKGSLCLAGLTKSIRAGDFAVQQTSRLRESTAERFPGIVDGLAEIDFAGVGIVLIGRGVNDYHAGTPIRDPEDPRDEYTFLGALRCAVEDLRRVNPRVRILFVTPTYTWYPEMGVTCEELDNGGGLLEEYVEAQLELGEELGIETVNLYHDFFPHERWEDWERYTTDGLHPNEAGRERIADRIAQTLLPADAPGPADGEQAGVDKS